MLCLFWVFIPEISYLPQHTSIINYNQKNSIRASFSYCVISIHTMYRFHQPSKSKTEGARSLIMDIWDFDLLPPFEALTGEKGRKENKGTKKLPHPAWGWGSFFNK